MDFFALKTPLWEGKVIYYRARTRNALVFDRDTKTSSAVLWYEGETKESREARSERPTRTIEVSWAGKQRRRISPPHRFSHLWSTVQAMTIRPTTPEEFPRRFRPQNVHFVTKYTSMVIKNRLNGGRVGKVWCLINSYIYSKCCVLKWILHMRALKYV